jgi:hypothetical protein
LTPFLFLPCLLGRPLRLLLRLSLTLLCSRAFRGLLILLNSPPSKLRTVGV